MINVGKYGIHGFYGVWKFDFLLVIPKGEFASGISGCFPKTRHQAVSQNRPFGYTWVLDMVGLSCGCSKQEQFQPLVSTPPETENRPLEKEIPIGNHRFNPMFVFRGGIYVNPSEVKQTIFEQILGGLIPCRRNFRNPTHRTNQQPTVSAIRFTDSRLPKTFFGGNSGLEQFREKFPKTGYGDTPPWKLTIPKRPKKKEAISLKRKWKKSSSYKTSQHIHFWGCKKCMLVSGEGMMDGNVGPESCWRLDSWDESKPGKERHQPLLEAWNERGLLQVPQLGLFPVQMAFLMAYK